MKRFGRGVVRGGAPISLYILCWSEKFPPSGVGFFTVRHPAHWGGDPPGGGGVRKSFLLALFMGATTKVPMQGITCLPVKQAGMEIPNTYLSAWENWLASCFFHRTPGRSSPWADRVQNRVPFHATEGRLWGEKLPSGAGITNSSGGGHGITP